MKDEGSRRKDINHHNQQSAIRNPLPLSRPDWAANLLYCDPNLARKDIIVAIPISLQLYTVRGDCEKDYAGTLRRVAEIGYAGVELAGCPLGAAELKSLTDDLGMRISGCHAGVDILDGDPKEAVDFNLSVGSSYMILPYLPDERRTSVDSYRRVAQRLNEIGAVCNQNGLVFCYHNHSFEFESFDGTTGYDILVKESDPALVQFEIDTYWVRHGGHDPADFIQALAARCPLLHIKDMAEGSGQEFAEIGAGILDWPGIFHVAESNGKVAWYIVEQDTCSGPPLESVKISLENLRRMGKV